MMTKSPEMPTPFSQAPRAPFIYGPARMRCLYCAAGKCTSFGFPPHALFMTDG